MKISKPTLKLKPSKDELNAVIDINKDLEIAVQKIEKGMFPIFPITFKQKFFFKYLKSNFEGVKDNTLFFMKKDGTTIPIPDMKVGFYSYNLKGNQGDEPAISHLSDNKTQIFMGAKVWFLKEGEFECYPHDIKQDSKKVQSALYNIDSGNKELQSALAGAESKKREFYLMMVGLIAFIGVVIFILAPDIMAGFAKNTVAPTVSGTTDLISQNLTSTK